MSVIVQTVNTLAIYTAGMSARPLTSPPVRCPECESVESMRTSQRLGEQTYFCRDCDHVWTVAPASVRAPASPRANRILPKNP